MNRMSERKVRITSMTVVGLSSLLTLAGGAIAGDVKLLGQPATFPIVISKPGSYRLRSNLVVPDAGTTAIRLDADGVTVDLNGYSISGPTVCTPIPVTSCTPSGGGSGIVGGTGGSDSTVVNGTISGMGSNGVSLGNRARIERVRAISNGNNGIAAAGSSIVTDCVTDQNFNRGIALGPSSIVRNNTAFGNREVGINLGDWTVATGNTASFNAYSGIVCNASCTLMGNVAHQNGGIAQLGSGSGIDSNGDSTVIGNTATANLGGGLDIGPGSGYVNNVVNGNNGGDAFQQVFGGFEMGTNVCGGDTTCP